MDMDQQDVTIASAFNLMRVSEEAARSEVSAVGATMVSKRPTPFISECS
jgi:hypothetical protein